MADFSLTTLFVVPVGNVLPSSGSTQDLTPGKFGFFRSNYSVATAGNIAALPYFYAAQGRTNTYLLATKKSDKISGSLNALGDKNVTAVYKTIGSPSAAVQITDISGFSVQCGDIVSLTLRAHSSYIDTLYYNGFTRSVSIKAPCCDCTSDPCLDVDVDGIIDTLIAKLQQQVTGANGDNISFNTFYTFERVGTGVGAILRISGKPLTVYAQPCDIAAFPHEYDRMWFRAFVYAGAATTADYLIDDTCDIVATASVVQRSSFPSGTASEIQQLEKNYYSYQAGYLKSLYRMSGYNGNFESWVSPGTVYDTFTIKFNDYDRSVYQWGDYVPIDATVIIAVPQALTAGVEAILEAALGVIVDDNTPITTTTTSSTTSITTSSTTTLNP